MISGLLSVGTLYGHRDHIDHQNRLKILSFSLFPSHMEFGYTTYFYYPSVSLGETMTQTKMYTLKNTIFKIDKSIISVWDFHMSSFSKKLYLLNLCLIIGFNYWFVPTWCLSWFVSNWCSLIEGLINKIYNLLHHILG